jgi:hypothetical protein
LPQQKFYRPFIDFFGLSRRLSIETAIPFTSRFLRIKRPSIINTHSAEVLGAFYLDLFNKFWDRVNPDDFENATALFYTFTDDFPNCMDELHTMTSGDASYSCNRVVHLSDFSSNIGIASIRYYGHLPDDFCLLLPSRDSGNLKYGPKIQGVQCLEIFLSAVCLEILEAILQEEITQYNTTVSAAA